MARGAAKQKSQTNQASRQMVRETNKPQSAQGLDLSVDLAPGNPHHLRLANPVMIASGTFGYDGYGRKAKIGGTMCYDSYGNSYVVKGSRYVIHYYQY